jgi:hypothetical protein
MNRETALQRLRTTGTLSSQPRSKTSITFEQLADPTAKLIGRIIVASGKTKAPRSLAASHNHAVLP